MSSNDLEFRYDDGKSPLALLAETCRNIGVDTTTSKLAKSSIVHNVSSHRLSTSKSSTSPSSSIESRKSNDSVSPLNNGSDKKLNLSSNNKPDVNVPNNREPIKFSFKPYEDNVICKKTSTEDSRNDSVCKYPESVQSSVSPQSNDDSKINKDNNNCMNASNIGSVISKREHETNNQSLSTIQSNGYHEKIKKIRSQSSSKPFSPNISPTLPKSSPSSITPTSTFTSTSTASEKYPADSSSKLHQLTSNSVNKPFNSPYMGLPYNSQPQTATVTGYCHTSVCRDPFCPGCRFNAACKVLGQVSTCAAGCVQCSNASPSISSSNSPYLTSSSFYPLLPVPHNLSKPLNQTPNSPNVSQPDDNFTSKREVHHAIRNHASSDSSATPFLGQYSLCPPMLTDPLAGLRRTIYDPINRYHPYKPFPNHPNGLTSGLMHLPLVHSVSSRSQIALSYPPQGPYAERLGPPIPP